MYIRTTKNRINTNNTKDDVVGTKYRKKWEMFRKLGQ